MNATDICRSLSNAALDAESCAVMSSAAKKQEVAKSQHDLSIRMWFLAEYWSRVVVNDILEVEAGRVK